MKLSIDVELRVVRHVADIGNTETGNLSQRVLSLLNPPLSREVAWHQGAEQTSDPFSSHVPVESTFAVLEEFNISRLRITEVQVRCPQRRLVCCKLAVVK